MGKPKQLDWANLGDGPAGVIADRLLASDVADYIRFRAVCQPWRRSSPDPRAGIDDGRFLPRRWIMLDKAITDTPRRHRFLNISTGESIRMDLHDERELLALTPEGLLMLFHEPTRVIRLLNPLTRHVTNLLPVTSLLLEDKRSMCPAWLSGIQVYGVGLADVASSMVAVCFSHPRVLAVAKPGDVCWTVVYSGYLHSSLPYAGRFYCCVGTRLMVLNTTTDQQTPRLMVAVERSSHMYFSQMAETLHLVDNAGELMLVHRLLYEDAGALLVICVYKRKYQLYSVDLDAGALVPAKGFNGRAVFMGHHRTISLAPETFPSIAADTLYLGYDFDEHLEDGSNDPSHDWTYPCSVINCLSNCIQLNGEQLA